jgi:outer membrane protein assembly factor BamB
MMAWKPRNRGGVVMSLDRKRLYCPSAVGLHALRGDTGKVAWEFVVGDAVEGSPVEVDGVVHTVTTAGNVHALDARTGQQRWPKPVRLDGACHAGPAVGQLHVYVHTDPGILTAVSRKTGKIAWRLSHDVQRQFLVEGHGAALVQGDVVYTGWPDGKLSALSRRDGGLLWEVQVGQRSKNPYVDVDTTPVSLRTAGGVQTLLTVGYNSGLQARAAANGRLLWHYAADGLGQPVVDGRRIWAIGIDGVLHVVDRHTGRRSMARHVGGSPSGALAIAHGIVFIPGDGGLQLVDASSGFGIARIIDEHGFAAAPLVRGHRMYIISNGGHVFALRLYGIASGG